MPAFPEVTVTYNGTQITPAPLVTISSSAEGFFASRGTISLTSSAVHKGSSVDFGISGIGSLRDTLVNVFRTDLGTLEIKRGDTSLFKKTCKVDQINFDNSTYYNQVPYTVDLSFEADHPNIVIFSIPIGLMPTGDGTMEHVVCDYQQSSDHFRITTGEIVRGIALDNFSTTSGVEVYRNGVRQTPPNDWNLSKGIVITDLTEESTDTFDIFRQTTGTIVFNNKAYFLGTGFYSANDLSGSLFYRNGQLLNKAVDYEQSGHFLKPLFTPLNDDVFCTDISGGMVDRTDLLITSDTTKLTVTTGNVSGYAIFHNGKRLVTGVDYNAISSSVASVNFTLKSGDRITIVTRKNDDLHFNLCYQNLANTIFRISGTPYNNTVRVFLNGQKLVHTVGLVGDYETVVAGTYYATGLTTVFTLGSSDYLSIDGIPSGQVSPTSGWANETPVQYSNIWLADNCLPTGAVSNIVTGVRLFFNGIRQILATNTAFDAQYLGQSGINFNNGITTSSQDSVTWDNASGWLLVNCTGWYPGGGPAVKWGITGTQVHPSSGPTSFILNTGDSTHIFLNGHRLKYNSDYLGQWLKEGVSSKLVFSGSGLTDIDANTLVLDLIYSSGQATGQIEDFNWFIPIDSGAYLPQTEIYVHGIRLTSGADYEISGYVAVLSGFGPLHVLASDSEVVDTTFDTSINMRRPPLITEGYVAFFGGDSDASIYSDGNPNIFSVFDQESDRITGHHKPVQLVFATGNIPHVVRHDAYSPSGQSHTGIHWFPPHLMLNTWSGVNQVYSSQPFHHGTPALYLNGLRMYSGADYTEENSSKLNLLRTFGSLDYSGSKRGVILTLDYSKPMFSGTVENAKHYWTESYNDTGIPLHSGTQGYIMSSKPCSSGTLRVYRDGLLMLEGSGNDFISTTNHNLALVNESLGFNRSDLNTLVLNRSIEIQGIASATNTALTNAKNAATILYGRHNAGTLNGNDLYIIAGPMVGPIVFDTLGNNYVTSRTETYDLEKATINIEETIEQNTMGPYQHTYLDTVELTQEGAVIAREEGTIRGYGIGSVRNTHAEYGYEQAITGVFTRLQSAANDYTTAFGITISLYNQKIINTKQKNEADGVVEYAIAYGDLSFASNVANQTVRVTDEDGGELEADISVPGKEDGVITQKIGTLRETTRTVDVELQGFHLKPTGIAYGENGFTTLETTAKTIINEYAAITGAGLLNVRLTSYQKTLNPMNNSLSVNASYMFTKLQHSPTFIRFNDTVFLLSGSSYYTSDGFISGTLELYETGVRKTPSSYTELQSTLLSTNHPSNGFSGSVDTAATIADYRRSWSESSHIGETLTSSTIVKNIVLNNSLATASSRVYVNGLRQLLGTDYTEDVAAHKIVLSGFTTGTIVVDYDSIKTNKVTWNKAVTYTSMDTAAYRTYVLPIEADTDAIRIYKNGLHLTKDVDWVVSNRSIVFATRITSSDKLIIDYVERAAIV